MASRLLLKFVEIIQPDYLQNCLSKSGLECNAFNQTIYKIVYQNQGWNATHSTRLFTKLFIKIRVGMQRIQPDYLQNCLSKSGLNA